MRHDRCAWVAAAKIALALKSGWVNERRASASTPGCSATIDNRLVWRAALGSVSFPSSLAPAVRFYLATWDGTGAIERGLGQDAAIQQQHVGQRARSCLDADVYSALLELHLDGPQAEEAVFTKSSDGVLHLTNFSQACAQQWLIQHGRRFCVQRVRKDKGKKRPERRKGTDSGVQLSARSAYETQCDMARADLSGSSASARRRTVLGVDHLSLMAALRGAPEPPAAKKTVRYRLATAKKLSEKTAAGTWSGWSNQVPRLRLGGGSSHGGSHPECCHASRASRTLVKGQAAQAALCLDARAMQEAQARVGRAATRPVEATPAGT